MIYKSRILLWDFRTCISHIVIANVVNIKFLKHFKNHFKLYISNTHTRTHTHTQDRIVCEFNTIFSARKGSPAILEGQGGDMGEIGGFLNFSYIFFMVRVDLKSQNFCIFKKITQKIYVLALNLHFILSIQEDTKDKTNETLF